MRYDDKLENFITAFGSGSGGCVRDCKCGRTFWDCSETTGGCWEPGEREALENDAKAVALDYSVSTIIFFGAEYVIDCDCWKPEATALMNGIDKHARQIAEYLSLEKKRKQKEADSSPVVK